MMLHTRRVCFAVIVAALTAGCSSTASVSGGNGTISIKESAAPGVNAPTTKYAATIRLLPYVDERSMGNPRKIGIGGDNIYGPNAPRSNDILLDRDVAAVVTSAMKKRLEDAGYQVVEDGNAHFEMGGTVKELTYNVRARDEVSITVATQLKESGTGKSLWSGVVEEKKDRFAGVSGNDIRDVAMFLKKELGVVTQKTSDAISAILMEQRPELFNLAPGTKPIAGVTVLNAASSVPPTMPVPTPAQGVLMVTTSPSRAKVYAGGVYYGLSPLRLEMEPGILEVTAKLDGYKNATEKVSVRKGETTEVELTLER